MLHRDQACGCPEALEAGTGWGGISRGPLEAGERRGRTPDRPQFLLRKPGRCSLRPWGQAVFSETSLWGPGLHPGRPRLQPLTSSSAPEPRPAPPPISLVTAPSLSPPDRAAPGPLGTPTPTLSSLRGGAHRTAAKAAEEAGHLLTALQSWPQSPPTAPLNASSPPESQGIPGRKALRGRSSTVRQGTSRLFWVSSCPGTSQATPGRRITVKPQTPSLRRHELS